MVAERESDLPSLAFLLGPSAWRLEGIGSWREAEALGRGNLERLLALARDRATEAHHRQLFDREEQREMAKGLGHLEAIARASTEHKPVLPRLRVEHFRVGDEVVVYVGDSPGAVAATPWVMTKVSAIDKAHNPSWATAEANSGYYWQVTVEARQDVFPGVKQLRFSTSEPRALLEAEWNQLREEVGRSSAFSRVWCENARRSWTPIWCLERGLAIDPNGVDFAKWLRVAR